MLTAEQKTLREGKLTASRVGCLMTGDADKIMRLWREMTGEVEEIDLSGVWPVRLGEATEALNVDWYEFKTRHQVSGRGKVIVGPEPWMAATLDGWDADAAHPLEMKHVGGFESEDIVLARYQPQLHWTMICTRSQRIALSVIYGAKEPVVDYIEYDEAYGKVLIERATNFMRYVHSFTPPIIMPPVEAPTLPTKEVNMMETSSANKWADSAVSWLENIDAKDKALAAEKELKSLVPIDAKVANGSGVVITRNRAGSLALRREA